MTAASLTGHDAQLYARIRHETEPTGEYFTTRTPAGPQPLTAEQQRHNFTLLQHAISPRQDTLLPKEERIPIRALTIRPPWSDLIAIEDEDLGKRIENRVWSTTWRGTLLIHGGLTIDTPALTLPDVRKTLPADYEPVQGAIVAVADLTSIHPDDGPCTPWSQPDGYHWELTRVQRLHQPVAALGAQRLWTPTRELLAKIAAANPALKTRLAA
ncbi:hypothetical protein ACTWQF_34030 [Streptomyces sp. 8N114]|uniref:hypothetical protein n=1 Tax=Streptomyces sp. 8N114 TaxID=3457419 RepID=UPI003FD17969